ncbi:MAG: DegT/DnrJ/EryC1/StrS family aminotransferase [Candidatus Margulisbacteria bacterium]|nr:DegT/DnrJ/EryC1/StrS family aminotransferase [Candidatus Margulisiibacteriota bacterium]
MAKRKKFLVFGEPLIEEPEIKEVEASLRSGWIGTGPKVAKFEEMFSNYIGTKYAIALHSCTAGLHLAMLVSGIKPGDEVITTPMTFCATANAIIHAGGKPVFVDIDRNTMNIDPKRIEKAITPRTKAIIPVHLAGRPCEMDPIMAIAQKHKLIVIEDAAHAIEAVYRGKKIGNIGDMGCFSFYVTKNIVTGEGGMVTTNNQEYADKIKIYGLHGMSRDAWKRFSDEGYKHYQVVYHGFKYNMMDIQAALGIHQLPRAEKYLKRRQEIWKKYDEAFQKLPVSIPASPEKDTVHAKHLYTLLIDQEKTGLTRDMFLAKMTKENIGVGVHYLALHLHKYYQDAFGYKPGDFPEAEYISERTVSLPLSAKLTNKDIDDVISAVKKILRKK